MSRKAAAPWHKAVVTLRRGGIVAYPTETYYGLAVDPWNGQALKKLFALKQRDPSKAVLVLISSRPMLDQLVTTIPKPFLVLMDRFWPGPLTLIFPCAPGIPQRLTGNTRTIGIRHSSHPLANQLVSQFGGPLTATSANVSGRPPAINPDQVREQFGGAIDLLLDGGETPGGAGSTLAGLDSNNRVCCLRPGVIPWKLINPD